MRAGPRKQILLQRIRGEYLEMPGLRLTAAQAQRLWTLDAWECERLFHQLVEERFLWQTAGGEFVRADRNSPSQGCSSKAVAS